MAVDAAQLLAQLQQQIQLNQDNSRPMAGIPQGMYGPRSLEAAEGLGFLGGNAFGRASGQVKMQEAAALDKMDRDAAMTHQQNVQGAPGMGQVARLMGIDPQQPGVGEAYGKMVASGIAPEAALTQLAANPQINPAVAAQQDAAQQAQMSANIKAQSEQMKLDQQLLAGERTVMAPLMQQRAGLNNTRDMMTLVGNEGSFRTPGQSRGAYRALRGRMLNDLRVQFEAGALQQAELEFFKSLLPEYEDLIQASPAERMAQLKEFEYAQEVKLRDDISLSGRDIDFDEFMGSGRSYDEIMTPGLPEGFEMTEGLGGTGTTGTDILTAPGALGGAQGTLPSIPGISEWGIGR